MTALTPTLLPPSPWMRSYGPARDRLHALVLHPDGARAIAAEMYGTAYVWDLASGAELARLPLELPAIVHDEVRGVSLDVTPDGTRLFVTVRITDGGDTVVCWDLERYAHVDTFGDERVPWRFIGEDLVISGHTGRLTLWRVSTGAVVRELAPAGRDVHGTVGEHVLVGGGETVELWHAPSGRRVWELPVVLVGPGAIEVRGAAVAPALDAVVLVGPGAIEMRGIGGEVVERVACAALAGGDRWQVRVDEALRTLLVVGAAPEVLAIDLESGAVRSRFAAASYARVEFAADARFAVVHDHAYAVWEIATGACVLRSASELAVAADGASAIVCDGARLRRVPLAGATAEPDTSARDLEARTAAWIAIAATSRGEVVAVDRASVVHVCDRAGAERATWQLGEGSRALGGDAIATIARDGAGHRRAIEVRDAASGALVRTIEGEGWAIALSADGAVVAATGDGPPVRAWSTADGAAATAFSVRTRPARVLAIERGAAGRFAVSSGADDRGAIELWRGGGQPMRLHTFASRTPATCAAFEPSGRSLVSGHRDGAILVRDTRARTHAATLEATAGAGPVRALAVHPARPVVAACGWNSPLAVWDLERAACLVRWTGDLEVYAVTWLAPDTLACATETGLALFSINLR